MVKLLHTRLRRLLASTLSWFSRMGGIASNH